MDERGASRDPATGRIRIAPGARAVERDLLDRVLALCEEARRDPELLARPVRIVVPSRSLREHLAARLAQDAPERAVAGIAVQTHFGLACEVLRRAGKDLSTGGQLLFPVLVRRLAREEPLLREALDELRDGYGAVTESVVDLLDAGMRAHLADALQDALEEAPASAARERARAVVRVALRALEALGQPGLEYRSSIFQGAAAALRDEPKLLPTRAILIHGFADATGAGSEWLEALVRYAGASVWIDHPPDPAGEAEVAPGVVFTARLLEKLERAAGESAVLAETPEPAADQLSLLPAPGCDAEARAAAEQIAVLLDGGARAESVGIVARDLTSYRAPLATQLRRLGVPFSGGRGLVGPVGRRLRGLLELLEQGGACPADRWLDAARERPRLEDAELRLALHSLGAGRLAQVASLDLGARLGRQDGVPLPVQLGLGEGSADGADEDRLAEPVRPTRRYAPRQLLEAAISEARRICSSLEAMRREETLKRLLDGLRQLLGGVLGWTPETAGREEIDAVLSRLEKTFVGDLRLDAAELRLLLARELRQAVAEPLGGAGGGVQVMDVTAARGRTFEHLFVLGMNRDLFPMTIPEDALLPDELRQCIEPVLESVPLKRRGFDEERYLFAQLCSAAPAVHLSWQMVSDEGRERPPSPLVERLRLARSEPGPEAAPLVLAPRGGDVPRPAFEHALLAGMKHGPDGLAALLPAALDAGREASDARQLAEVRRRVLAEQDPRDARRHRLGPFHGFVGAPLAGDPREPSPWVTFLEAEARCPWQVFLQRILVLQPRPDALDALPDAESAPVGSVVHRVLEAIAVRAGVETRGNVAEAVARDAVVVPWPEEPVLEAELERAARAVAWQEGLVHPAAATLLKRRARSCLECVRELEWAAGATLPGVVGVELEGRAAVRDGHRAELALRFRADRADRSGAADESHGILRLTDYKTGKALSHAKRVSTRDRHLRDAVGSGRRLQAAAYAFCEAGERTEGRYVFAHPDEVAEYAVARIEADDDGAREIFETAVRALLDLRREGAFVPRLVLGPSKDEEPRTCKRCEVAEACHRGETGARQRLFSWLGSDEAQRARESPAEGAARAVLGMEDKQ